MSQIAIGARHGRGWRWLFLVGIPLFVLLCGPAGVDAYTAPSGAGVSTGGALCLHATVGQASPWPMWLRSYWSSLGGDQKPSEDGPPAGGVVVVETRLLGIHPNPFNPTTVITYSLARQTRVTLSIFAVTGRRVRTLVGERVDARGIHTISWDGRADDGGTVGSGVYLCRLEADGKGTTAKMILLR